MFGDDTFFVDTFAIGWIEIGDRMPLIWARWCAWDRGNYASQTAARSICLDFRRLSAERRVKLGILFGIADSDRIVCQRSWTLLERRRIGCSLVINDSLSYWKNDRWNCIRFQGHNSLVLLSMTSEIFEQMRKQQQQTQVDSVQLPRVTIYKSSIQIPKWINILDIFQSMLILLALTFLKSILGNVSSIVSLPFHRSAKSLCPRRVVKW